MNKKIEDAIDDCASEIRCAGMLGPEASMEDCTTAERRVRAALMRLMELILQEIKNPWEN